MRYYNLLTSGKLNDYLVDVESWAQQMFDELVKTLSRSESLTEDFKATAPMEWVRKSNNIRNRADVYKRQRIQCINSKTHPLHAAGSHSFECHDKALPAPLEWLLHKGSRCV